MQAQLNEDIGAFFFFFYISSQWRHIVRASVYYIAHNKTPKLCFTDLPSHKNLIYTVSTSA